MPWTTTESGIFAQWQPRYAEFGIPTFPVDGAAKRPSVRGYLNVGFEGSRQLAMKFGAVEAFGVALGVRNRITVLDVDTADERVLADALGRYGPTRFVVRSGSGNYQAWYRHAGEGRRIRPMAGLPIDILGAGYVVAPPSRGRSGAYQIIQGSLEDLRHLPTMRRNLNRTAGNPQVARRVVFEGQRNDFLFKVALQTARRVDDFESLLDVMRSRNDQECAPVLPDAEIVNLCKSAWRFQQEGRNVAGSGRTVFTTFDEIDALAAAYPDALALLMVLRRYHNDRPEFALGKAMAAKLGWTLPRFRSARTRLETFGFIRCVRSGGSGPKDPPAYALTEKRGTKPLPNLNLHLPPSALVRQGPLMGS